jgi:hypothetical protein
MILGARARLDFIYIDRPLVEAVRVSHEVPEWLQWNTNYFGSPKSGKEALFLLVFETFTVPGGIVEPGNEIVFSCGADSVTWVVPGK